MNIDSHQHFWRYDAVRDAWITDAMAMLKRDFLPEDLAGGLTANGMDASIAVQADQSENETMFLLDLAEANNQIVGVVGWIDLSVLSPPGTPRTFSHFRSCVAFGISLRLSRTISSSRARTSSRLSRSCVHWDSPTTF